LGKQLELIVETPAHSEPVGEVGVPSSGTRARPRTVRQWIWAHRRLCISLLLALGFVLFNVIAYNHARAMTHFPEAGSRHASPPSLARWQKLQLLLTGVTIPRPMNDRTPDDLGLRYETHTFPGRVGADLEVWHVPHASPNGQVILFHGYAASKANLL